mmetsp:Transcript_71918/g.181476  ORF Transcript_71918/g.181476 Transcript_71918/m.181476 type:complete len:90 (+) Transcript_71918:751-1020(+)
MFLPRVMEGGRDSDGGRDREACREDLECALECFGVKDGGDLDPWHGGRGSPLGISGNGPPTDVPNVLPAWELASGADSPGNMVAFAAGR